MVERILPPAPAPRPIISYPDSDGEPMADNDMQYRVMTDTRFALEQFYRNDPNVYVGANLLVYYAEGDPSQCFAPDVLVSLDVSKGMRRNYLIWEEGKPPDVVFEIASPRTWRGDLGWKRGLYLALGIREYFLFDPGAEFFRPLLQGFRKAGELYQPIPRLPAGRGVLGLFSEMLGLELWAQADGLDGMPYVLRLYHAATGEWLSTPAEEAEARRREAEARQREAEARRAAEARAAEMETRLADLLAELERLRGKA
jgi:Uma2 family endonuclease